jgi:hypothetical protein
MYNDSSAYTKDKDMWLAELDFDPTDDTDMLSAANSDEYHILSFLWTALDDFSKKGDSFASLRTFMDVDLSDHDDKNINTQQLAWRRPKLESHPTVEKLFDLVIEEGETVKEATLITGINIITAQYYIKKYNDDDERRLPDGYRRPRVRHSRKLTDAYSQFLMKYIDMHPTAVLAPYCCTLLLY